MGATLERGSGIFAGCLRAARRLLQLPTWRFLLGIVLTGLMIWAGIALIDAGQALESPRSLDRNNEQTSAGAALFARLEPPRAHNPRGGRIYRGAGIRCCIFRATKASLRGASAHVP